MPSGALGLDRPLLVGHSMGGMNAAEMAAVAPREVERLGLIAPAGLWLDMPYRDTVQIRLRPAVSLRTIGRTRLGQSGSTIAGSLSAIC